ncbi:MAG: recombinase family protein [Sphingobium sp.]|uniref:recombinase family protein n=1 Tax=Sphingobium sp. TaxID=1912891 RepID=UPI0029BADF57|nr:recombinase family protein [Sphingobium sp.]MDX3910888.1 recombinase family protein [Sphingobium sp.]
MLVGYARVSSSGQSLEVQQDQLTAAGCEKVFAEKRSGTSTEGRQALEDAIEFCREGDTLAVTRLDRLARSGGDLYGIVNRLNTKGVAFRCLQQGAVDTTTSMGKLVLGILGAVAEFETDIRRERQRDGIERTKAANPERYRGRRPSVDQEAIRALAAQGVGPTAIAKQLGYGRMTVYRVLRDSS